MTREVSPSKRALEVLSVWRASMGDTPVDPELLCNEVINRQSNGDTLTIMRDSFDGSFDGMMKFNNQTRKGVAIINKNVSSVGRINFTTFHEIYHFVGHRDKQALFHCSGRDLSDYITKPFEIEANRFASMVLVPRDIVRRSVMSDFNTENVRSLADKLNASVEAVAYAWMETSRKPLAFVKAQSGIIVSAFPNQAARNQKVFIPRDVDLPDSSITAESMINGSESCGEVEQGTWSKYYPAYESSYLGTDSWTYSFIEFIIE